LGANVYETTLVWSLGGIINVLLTIPLAIFSDRFGRKTAILLTPFFVIIPNLAYTRVTSWEQLIPLKMVADVAWVLYMPAEAAMIADISVSSTRGRMYGIIRLAHPIGSIIAPLVGAFILDNFGWNAVFYAIVLFGIFLLVPSFFMTETRKKQAVEDKRESKGSLRKNFKAKIDVGFLYPLLIFSLFRFFTGMGQQGLSQITPIYLEERFNATSFQQGLFFSIGTMVPWLITSLVGGWLADRYSRKKIIIVSFIVYPFLMGFWPSMNSYNSVLFLQMLIRSTRMITMPATSAYLMDYTDENRRGLASGIATLGGRLGGRTISTPLLGYLYENYGLAIPFYAAALLPLPSIPILMLLKEKGKKEN
jgi:MFS family permease